MTVDRLALLRERLPGLSFEVRWLEGQQVWVAHAYSPTGQHWHAGSKDEDDCFKKLITVVKGEDA